MPTITNASVKKMISTLDTAGSTITVDDGVNPPVDLNTADQRMLAVLVAAIAKSKPVTVDYEPGEVNKMLSISLTL